MGLSAITGASTGHDVGDLSRWSMTPSDGINRVSCALPPERSEINPCLGLSFMDDTSGENGSGVSGSGIQVNGAPTTERPACRQPYGHQKGAGYIHKTFSHVWRKALDQAMTWKT